MSTAAHSNRVSQLVKQVSTLCKQEDDLFSNKSQRAALLQSVKQLAFALEEPADAVYQCAFSPGHITCVRIAIDLKLFEHIVEHDSGKGITAKELALRSQAEQLLIVRIMRTLAGIGFVAEDEEEVYSATPISVQMCSPAYQGCIKHHFDFGARVLVELPDYLKTTGYKSPTDHAAGPFQQAFNTALPTFDYWATLPGVMQNFNTYMTGNQNSRTSWIDWYPIEERLLKDLRVDDDDAALIVDIAGGRGHYLAAFREKFPHAKGRMILQEVPEVIDDVKDLHPSIERMKYDMFEPQPIKGARIYFYHFILHDWSDTRAHHILTAVAAAMNPGYSKLILSEFILPNTNTPLLAAGFDLQMMAMHSGMERSERQWRVLIEGAGLVVEKVAFPLGGMGEGVIEAVRGM